MGLETQHTVTHRGGTVNGFQPRHKPIQIFPGTGLNDLRIASSEPSAFVLKADSVAVSLGHEQGIVESIALEFHGGEIGRDVAKISAQERAALERPFEGGR